MSDSSFNKTSRKVWILAGEASGDTYGAYLVRALQELEPELAVSGMGGNEMRSAGVEILVDSTNLGVTGIIEVLKMYPTFRRIFKDLVARAEQEKPDAVVCIDYPGFNLRFAREMKRLGIPVVYYISPQIWAWKKGRGPKIAEVVEHMMVIFPFEEHIYDDFGLKTTFVGHPLVEILATDNPPERDENLVLLLPGSRFNEVDKLFPAMYATASQLTKDHPNLRFAVPTPRETVSKHVEELIAELRSTVDTVPDISVSTGQNNQLMRTAIAGLAASGTVTVQCAILGLPLVSVYKVNPITLYLVKRTATMEHFTMVNIIAEKRIFEEFAQADVNPGVLTPAMQAILPGGSRRDEVLADMDAAVRKLGSARPASRNAAEIILQVIQ